MWIIPDKITGGASNSDAPPVIYEYEWLFHKYFFIADYIKSRGKDIACFPVAYTTENTSAADGVNVDSRRCFVYAYIGKTGRSSVRVEFIFIAYYV